MKKLIAAFLLITIVIPTLASEISEFERGFQAGKAMPTKLIVCTIPEVNGFGGSGEEVKIGRNRTEILEKNYNPRFIKALIESGKEIPCSNLPK